MKIKHEQSQLESQICTLQWIFCNENKMFLALLQHNSYNRHFLMVSVNEIKFHLIFQSWWIRFVKLLWRNIHTWMCMIRTRYSNILYWYLIRQWYNHYNWFYLTFAHYHDSLYGLIHCIMTCEVRTPLPPWGWGYCLIPIAIPVATQSIKYCLMQLHTCVREIFSQKRNVLKCAKT